MRSNASGMGKQYAQGEPATFSFSKLIEASGVSLQQQLGRLPPFPNDLRSCLICGPPKSERVALESAPPRPPFTPPGLAPPSQSIHIKYLDTLADLVLFASSCHLLASPPGAVIVHGINHLLCTESGTSEREGGLPIPLLVTDSSNSLEGCKSLYIFQRWLQICVGIRASQVAGIRASQVAASGGGTEFEVSVLPSFSGSISTPLPAALASASLSYGNPN
eukprot:gene7674-832_t